MRLAISRIREGNNDNNNDNDDTICAAATLCVRDFKICCTGTLMLSLACAHISPHPVSQYHTAPRDFCEL